MPSYRLPSIIANNFGTKVVSVIVAIVFWFVVFGSRTESVRKEVPIEVITADRLIVANDIPSTILFQLSGPKAFLRSVLDRREAPIRVNLSAAKQGEVKRRFFSDDIRLPIGVKVQSISPASLTFNLQPVVEKTVSLKLAIEGEAPEGYQLLKKSISPRRVTLSGAQSALRRVRQVKTKPIDLSELRGPFEGVVELDLPSFGVMYEGELPMVRLDLQPVVANFKVSGVGIEVRTQLKYETDVQAITLFVRSERKEGLDEGVLKAYVDVRNKPPGEYELPISVESPEGIGIVKVIPEKVKVKLY